MSVTFSWAGCEAGQQIKMDNVDTVHVFDLLAIDLEPGLTGEIEAAHLALSCVYTLMVIDDIPEIDNTWWRRGYLRKRLIELRDLAQAAGCYPISYF